MFRSLRPKPLEPLPLPFRNRREEREAERKRAREHFANIELDRAPGFSWNQERVRPPLAMLIKEALTQKLGAAIFSVTMGLAIIAAFLALSRVGLPAPPPRIIYVEDWSGAVEPGKPIPRLAPEVPDREAALARERAAAREASPSR